MKYKLCYVKDNIALFTTQSLSKQWGDDWDDATFEHNADKPYSPCWHNISSMKCTCEICKRDWNKDGTPKWWFRLIKFVDSFVLNKDIMIEDLYQHINFNNSYLSIKDIKIKKTAAWIYSKKDDDKIIDSLYANSNIKKFKKFIKKNNGIIIRDILLFDEENIIHEQNIDDLDMYDFDKKKIYDKFKRL